MGKKKQLSGAQKRKKKKEREEAAEGCGAVEAWSDDVVEWVGDASEGCVCLACDFEIEYDRSAISFQR